MTLVEMISLFDLIQDKVDTIYFTDAEKIEFLNTAQRVFVESILFNPEKSVDSDKKVDALLYPIIDKDITITPSSGDPTHVEIDTQVSGTVMYILSAQRQNGVAGAFVTAKWVRENEKGSFADNTFKAPSVTNPWVETDGTTLKFTPTCTDNAKVSTVREPVDMVTGVTDCELPVSVHEKVVGKAVALAGLASDDEALIAATKLI